jgi:hypothetical protein
LEAEAEEMETAVVAVMTAEMVEALETAAVTLMTVVLTIKAAATLVMTTAAAAATALIEAAVTERAAAVYQRGRWSVSNISDVRTMWNITTSYSAAGDTPICPVYTCAYSVLALPNSHLVDLVPCIYARPYKAIPPGFTPIQPQEH